MYDFDESILSIEACVLTCSDCYISELLGFFRVEKIDPPPNCGLYYLI